MNILFDINHPAHVHYFRNAIAILVSKGHSITITAREKDVTVPLLRNYQLPFLVLSKAQKGLWRLGLELIIRQLKLLPILINKKINVCVSATGACSVHICKLLGIPTLVFYDTEDATLQNALSIPFATKYVTPDSYLKKVGKNHITYAGVQEMAYLQPKYFQPDNSVLDLLKIHKGEKYIVMRFVAWQAAHDRGETGLSLETKRKIIQTLSKHAKIFILSEAPLTEEFQPYRFSAPPNKAHDLLYFATLYIGESATMASESACLGTPAIYVSSRKLGYVKEGGKYDLIFDLENDDDILKKAEEIITHYDQTYWDKKREIFLNHHIDVTQFFVKTILEFGKGK